MWSMRSYFPNQGANLHPLHWKHSLDHWAVREVQHGSSSERRTLRTERLSDSRGHTVRHSVGSQCRPPGSREHTFTQSSMSRPATARSGDTKGPCTCLGAGPALGQVPRGVTGPTRRSQAPSGPLGITACWSVWLLWGPRHRTKAVPG